MRSFSKDEIELMSHYVTNPEGDIFVVHNMPGLVGPTFVRYSRASGGYREILIDEFLKKGVLNAKQVEDLITKVLIAYGDDSVGELEGTHLSLENVSNLATKEIEDRRIGGSPIEQSSRYVVYDQRGANGNFRYYRDPKIMASRHAQAFVDGMDKIFETYLELIGSMKEHFERLKPIAEAEYAIKPNDPKKYRLEELTEEREKKDFQRTWGFDTKTKACDTVRGLLPAATQTNVGIFGNGRFFQNVLTRMYSSELDEMPDIARRAHEELNKVVPVFVKRAKRSEYLVETERNMRELSTYFMKNVVADKTQRVTLLENKGDSTFVTDMVAQMLFKYGPLSLPELRIMVEGFTKETRESIIKTYKGNRRNRFDRSGRALEHGYPLTFNLIGDFGIYRDLQRHRMLTQERQLLTTELGFDIPPAIIDAGVERKVGDCTDISRDLWTKLSRDISPKVAQYAVLFGFNIQWMMGMNLREAQHMFELRTGPQGHPNYRKMCQEMNRLVKEKFPQLAGCTEFVDNNEYMWARADSEARQRQKERALEEGKQ